MPATIRERATKRWLDLPIHAKALCVVAIPVLGLLLQVNSYLRKPVDFDEFRDMVKRIGFYWLVVNQTPTAATHEGRA